MNPLSLLKLINGGIGPAEIMPMLEGMGIEMKLEAVETAAAPKEFTALAKSACFPGAGLTRISGKLKNGERVHALLIVSK